MASEYNSTLYNKRRKWTFPSEDDRAPDAPETDTSAQTSSESGKAHSPLVVHRAFYNKCIRKTIFVAYEVDREWRCPILIDTRKYLVKEVLNRKNARNQDCRILRMKSNNDLRFDLESVFKRQWKERKILRSKQWSLISDMLCLYFKGNFNRYRYKFGVQDPQLNL
ncbi:hypothetical protein TSAR_010988 [Trichomalopsis sarcophagae]|uniref:Uncharacterized protein n=1 Tax=Trichomalopsis sarcophagae TaxID=543379 RepID=A0A232EN50_9HYME|nr:hypothetical protein TSAR_010988 [Trichomalopsis sarcophagae]